MNRSDGTTQRGRSSTSLHGAWLALWAAIFSTGIAALLGSVQLHDAIFLQHSDGVGNRVFANPIDQIWLQAGTAFDYGNNAYFVDPHAALGLTISLILLGLISAGAVLLGAPRGLRSLFIVGWLATVVACSIACMVRSGIQYDPLYAPSRTNATLSDGLTYGAQAGVVIGLLVGFLLILVSGVADRVVGRRRMIESRSTASEDSESDQTVPPGAATARIGNDV